MLLRAQSKLTSSSGHPLATQHQEALPLIKIKTWRQRELRPTSSEESPRSRTTIKMEDQCLRVFNSSWLVGPIARHGPARGLSVVMKRLLQFPSSCEPQATTPPLTRISPRVQNPNEMPQAAWSVSISTSNAVTRIGWEQLLIICKSLRKRMAP